MKHKQIGFPVDAMMVICLSIVPCLGIASSAEAGGTVAVIGLVTRAAAGPDDQSTVLPASEHVFLPGSAFVVEVWAQTPDPSGLSSVSLDVTYTPIVSVTSVIHTAIFSELQHGLVDNAAGFIDDLSGSHLGPCSDQVGVAPQWVRVVTLQMSADTEGETTMVASNANSLVYGTAVCGAGDADPATIAFGTVPIIVSAAGIPAVSEWGMIVLAMSLTAVATIVFGKRMHGMAASPS